MKLLGSFLAFVIAGAVAWWVAFHGVSGPAVCAEWERYVVAGLMIAGGLAYAVPSRYSRDAGPGIVSNTDWFVVAANPAIRALVGATFMGAVIVALLAASPWLGDSDAEKRRAQCGISTDNIAALTTLVKLLETRIIATEGDVKQLETTPAHGRKGSSRMDLTKGRPLDAKPRAFEKPKGDGDAMEKLKVDIETAKEKTEERINRWGTMFAWLIALAAVILSLIVWMAQAASEDSRRRLEALDQKLTLENRLKVGQAAAKVARAGSRIQLLKETLFEANPEWQFVNKLHGLICEGEHCDASDFNSGNFVIYLETINELDLSILNRELIKPPLLETAVRSLADFLVTVGNCPWLSSQWKDTVARVYALANKLSKL